MPALKNPKHETFAHHRSKGVGQTDAARLAGYSYPEVEGSKLARRPEVIARIAELDPMYAAQRVEANMEETLDDAERIVRELWDVHAEAKQTKDRSNRLKSLDQIAKLRGLYTTRIDATVTSPLDGRNALVLQRFLAALDGETIEGEAEEILAVEVEQDAPASQI